MSEDQYIYEADFYGPRINKIKITRKTDKSFWEENARWSSGARRIGPEHHNTWNEAYVYLIDRLTARVNSGLEELKRRRDDLEKALKLKEEEEPNA